MLLVPQWFGSIILFIISFLFPLKLLRNTAASLYPTMLCFICIYNIFTSCRRDSQAGGQYWRGSELHQCRVLEQLQRRKHRGTEAVLQEPLITRSSRIPGSSEWSTGELLLHPQPCARARRQAGDSPPAGVNINGPGLSDVIVKRLIHTFYKLRGGKWYSKDDYVNECSWRPTSIYQQYLLTIEHRSKSEKLIKLCYLLDDIFIIHAKNWHHGTFNVVNVNDTMIKLVCMDCESCSQCCVLCSSWSKMSQISFLLRNKQFMETVALLRVICVSKQHMVFQFQCPVVVECWLTVTLSRLAGKLQPL